MDDDNSVPVHYQHKEEEQELQPIDEVLGIADSPGNKVDGLRSLIAWLSSRIEEECRKKNITCTKDLVLMVAKDTIWIIATTLVVPGKKIKVGMIATRLALKYSPEVSKVAESLATEFILTNQERLGIIAKLVENPAIRKLIKMRTTKVLFSVVGCATSMARRLRI